MGMLWLIKIRKVTKINRNQILTGCMIFVGGRGPTDFKKIYEDVYDVTIENENFVDKNHRLILVWVLRVNLKKESVFLFNKKVRENTLTICVVRKSINKFNYENFKKKLD